MNSIQNKSNIRIATVIGTDYRCHSMTVLVYTTAHFSYETVPKRYVWLSQMLTQTTR